MNYHIRPICEADNAQVEQVIRSCLVEFGANHEGTAWADPDLGRFSFVYSTDGSRYWVAEDEAGKIVAEVGIGPLPGADGVCELQKMYCLPECRGTGLARRLMETALAYAARFYQCCYLETLPNMLAAQKLYQRYGFQRLQEPLVPTTHFACDVRYLKEL